jgi:hypothetical protein
MHNPLLPNRCTLCLCDGPSQIERYNRNEAQQTIDVVRYPSFHVFSGPQKVEFSNEGIYFNLCFMVLSLLHPAPMNQRECPLIWLIF